MTDEEYKDYVDNFIQLSEYARERVAVHSNGLEDNETVRGYMLLAIDDILRHCAMMPSTMKTHNSQCTMIIK